MEKNDKKKLWRIILCAVLLIAAVSLSVIKCQKDNNVNELTPVESRWELLDSTSDSRLPDALVRAQTYENPPLEFLDNTDDCRLPATLARPLNYQGDISAGEALASWIGKLTESLPQVSQLWILLVVYITLLVLLLRILAWGCVGIVKVFCKEHKICKSERVDPKSLSSILESTIIEIQKLRIELEETIQELKEPKTEKLAPDLNDFNVVNFNNDTLPQAPVNDDIENAIFSEDLNKE